MSYPPYGHLAKITLAGSEDEVRLAVKSGVRLAPGTGVEMTGPAAVPAGPAGETVWRLLLCGRRRRAVAEAASRFARMAATRRGRLRARIEVDPEEV